MGMATFNRYRRIAEEQGRKGLEQLEQKHAVERPEPGSPVNPFTSEIPEQPQPVLPEHPEQQPQPGIVPQTQPYTLPPENDAAVPSIQPNFAQRSEEQQAVADAADQANLEAQKVESERNQQKMSEEGSDIQEQEKQVANAPDENTPTEPVGAPAPSQTEKDNETAEQMMDELEEDDTSEEPTTPRRRGRPKKNPSA